MNLYEQQASNRRKTWLVMLAFVAFFLFLGFGFDTFYIGAGGGVVPIGSVIALGVGSVSAAVELFLRRSRGARWRPRRGRSRS